MLKGKLNSVGRTVARRILFFEFVKVFSVSPPNLLILQRKVELEEGIVRILILISKKEKTSNVDNDIIEILGGLQIWMIYQT